MIARQRGVSKFEFSVVVAVIGVISLFGIDRLLVVQELAERTLVETTIRNVDSGIRFGMAEHMIHGEEARIGEMAGSNPVRWLERTPAGYLGEVADWPRDVPEGSWLFNATRRELGYQPRLRRMLETETATPPLLRWRIESSNPAPTTMQATAARIVVVAPYRWR